MNIFRLKQCVEFLACLHNLRLRQKAALQVQKHFAMTLSSPRALCCGHDETKGEPL